MLLGVQTCPTQQPLSVPTKQWLFSQLLHFLSKSQTSVYSLCGLPGSESGGSLWHFQIAEIHTSEHPG